jgi:hypothetical protein
MRYSRTLPLCYGLVVVAWSRADHYAVVLKVAESSQTDGPKVGEVVLGNLVLIFLGMFLIFGFYRLYIFFNKYYKNIYKNII